ncbi:MAG: transcriptional repressor [Alistipes sp.]|jgi:Fe2+ or Zn2+ uptake regulation protein|nr:transcriptional repressor [Alistipes sp.]
MYKKAREHLLKYNIRPSLQRLAIVEYLLSVKSHPTADTIYSAIHTDIPTLSRTTVYTTVSMLAGRGVILALDLDPEQMHYDGDITPHAHFLCTRCGHIYDIWFNGDGWGPLLAAAPMPQGASVSDIQLSYKGLCADCRGMVDKHEPKTLNGRK